MHKQLKPDPFSSLGLGTRLLIGVTTHALFFLLWPKLTRKVRQTVRLLYLNWVFKWHKGSVFFVYTMWIYFVHYMLFVTEGDVVVVIFTSGPTHQHIVFCIFRMRNNELIVGTQTHTDWTDWLTGKSRQILLWPDCPGFLVAVCSHSGVKHCWSREHKCGSFPTHSA